MDRHTQKEVEPSSSDSQKPENISSRLWEKFQSLKEKRQEISRKSRERKLKALKKQKDASKEEEKATRKDEETDALAGADRVKIYTAENEPETTSETSKESQENWNGIREFLDCNSHLSVDHSKPAPKSGMEKQIDNAIEQGDFVTAERLSDQLATREFASKITAAIDARNFTTKRKRVEEEKKAKKKKKLHWGFEHKEKWEMKANM